MNCRACTRRTLGLFIRSFVKTEPLFFPRGKPAVNPPPSRSFSHARRLQSSEQTSPTPPKPAEPERKAEKNRLEVKSSSDATEKPAWQVQKAALKEKLGGAAWSPRKKLSPDTMEGIRHLNKTQPEKFITPVLAQHFKVSPEAVRRILKSKWRPSDEEQEERLRRWDKRGERIWSNLVEMGVKPPKKWREMGVGKAERRGEAPRWKTGKRNTVAIQDSVDLYEAEDIIPIVDGKSGESRPSGATIPLWGRI